MSLPDKHDRRKFRHYAKVAPDGTVLAIVEVHDAVPPPTDGQDSIYVDVTDAYPYDFTGVQIDMGANLTQALKAANRA